MKKKIDDKEEVGMVKVVVNRCFGGFGLSHEAIMLYAQLKGIKLYPYIDKTTKEIYKISTVEEALAANVHMGINYATRPMDEDTYDDDYDWIDREMERDDPILVKVIEQLGEKADGWSAKLEVVEVPSDVEWEIDEYDGSEQIAENHRTW